MIEQLQALGVSAGVVAIAEIGDKTQLLSLLLAARFRKPPAIILGIVAATLANHSVAALLGNWLQRVIDGQWLRWSLGFSFLAMAGWMLIPDRSAGARSAKSHRWGIFGVSFAAFFLAEMGDKTQIATVMLAAQFTSLWAVVAGSTLGLLLVNVPTVLFGATLQRRLPLGRVRLGAAIMFVVLGVMVMVGATQ